MIEIDDSRFPVIEVRFVGAHTDAQLAAYLDAMEAMMLARRGTGSRAGLILDATKGGGTTARQRKVQADWLARHAALIEETTVGSAFVFGSALMRGFLTAILWMTPMPGDHAIFATSEEAFAWCRERHERHGAASLPPRP